MSVTKADMAARLIEKMHMNKQQATALVDDFFEEACCVLARGQPVKLTGFGAFELRDKAARPGRNPKTGDAVRVSARRVVIFRPSQVLKDRLTIIPAGTGAKC